MNDIGFQLGIAGVILAILGIGVTIYLSKESRPLFAILTNVLQGVTHPDLEIRFRRTKVPNIFSVRFVIWNAGRKELRKNDIPLPQAGPRIAFSKGTKLLSYTATTTTGDKSGQLILNEPNELCASFDYLNKGDAIFGEILCTTNNKTLPDARLLGNFKGSILKLGEVQNLSTGDHIFFSITALAMFLVTAWNAKSAYLAFVSRQTIGGVIWSIITLTSLWLTFVDIRFNILSIPNKLPKNYKHYLDYGSLS